MNLDLYHELSALSKEKGVTLVAVSKHHPVSAIKTLYDLGQRDFGENQVQELLTKSEQLPKDIRWHMIGHLQRNKVKQILPFVHLIHSVDSQRLYEKISDLARLENRKISILLQLRIAEEESKYGLDPAEMEAIISDYENESNPSVDVRGLMGMATYTNDQDQIKSEFEELMGAFTTLHTRISRHEQPSIRSFGMSADYELAMNCGSNMIRVGSKIFGNRKY